MVYTQEEKKKMDNAIQVFAEYTAGHSEFDIAYSEKTGYVRLIIAEFADQIFFPLKDFDELMDMFCMEIISEEVKKQTENDPLLKNQDVDYVAIRSRLQSYIDKLEKSYQPQAMNVVDLHLLSNRMNMYLP